MDITEIFSDLAAKAETENPQNEGDYIGEDGLLYCGKCHTPKQQKVIEAFSELFDGGVMNCLCKCGEEKRDLEEKKNHEKQEQIKRELYKFERRDSCFSDEFYKSMSFGADKSLSPTAVKAAHYYVDNFERLSAENMGLMFLGNVGTGKTFAACCIANALIDKGYQAWVITTGDLIRKAGNFNTGEETFLKIRDVDLLIVDDFGTQSNSEYNLGLLFDIIDKRYKAKKPLIITSNLTANDLKSTDNTQLKRIYSRVIEMCSCPISPVVLTGEELRSGIARRKHGAVI